MSRPNVRKIAYSVEEIFHEGGPAPETYLRRAVAMAIIEDQRPIVIIRGRSPVR